MPWRPLQRLIFGLAIHPFAASQPDDLPLQVGDEVYIIEQGGRRGEWFRGYLVAPPSLLAGLSECDTGATTGLQSSLTTSSGIGAGRGGAGTAGLEARVYSGIFPRCCVHLKEVLGRPDSGYAGDGDRDAGLDNADPAGPKGEANDQVGPDDIPSLTRWPPQSPMVRPAVPPPAPIPLLKLSDDSPSGTLSDSAADEAAACIREWHATRLHRLVLGRSYDDVTRLGGAIARLDGARRQLVRGVLTRAERGRLAAGLLADIGRSGGLVRHPTLENEGGEVDLVRAVAESASRPRKDEEVAPTSVSKPLDEKAWAALTSQPVVSAASRRSFPAATTAGSAGVGAPTAAGRADDEHVPRHVFVDFTSAISEITSCMSSSGTDGLTVSVHVAAEKRARLEPVTECRTIDVAGREEGKVLFSGLRADDVGLADSVQMPGRIAKGAHLVFRLYAAETVREPVVLAPGVNPGLMPSVIGSIKGRRSLMWGRRQAKPDESGSTTASPARRERERERERPEKDRADRERSRDQDSNSPGSNTARAGKREGKTVKRLIAAGSAFIGPAQLGVETRLPIRLFKPWNPTDGTAATGWDPLLTPALLPSRTGKYTAVGADLGVRLCRFVHPDVAGLAAERATVLAKTPIGRRIGGPSASSDTVDVFITVHGIKLATAARLSHPKTGSVPVPPAATGHNLQLTMEVRREGGRRIESCVYHSSGGPPTTAWRTAAVGSPDRWDAVVRLAIPRSEIRTSHVVMSVADSPGFPFALAWLPLWPDAAVPTGSHDLALHAYDEHTSSVVSGRGAYLSLPWAASATGDETAVLQLSAAVSGSDEIAPGKPVQDVLDLPASIDSVRAGRVASILAAVVKAGEELIVPSLSGLLNALFCVADAEIVAGSDVSLIQLHDLLLDAFSRILSLTSDRRFDVGRTVDQFIRTFPGASPKAAVVLLTALQRAVSRVVDEADDADAGRRARDRVKSAVWLIRLIVRVPESGWAALSSNTAAPTFGTLLAGTTLPKGVGSAGGEAVSFSGVVSIPPPTQQAIASLLSTVRLLLRLPSTSSTVLTQTVVLQHVHSWLAALVPALPSRLWWVWAKGIVDACTPDPSTAAANANPSSGHQVGSAPIPITPVATSSSGPTAVLAVWRLILIRHVVRLGRTAGIDDMADVVAAWLADSWGDRACDARLERPTGQFEAQVRCAAAIVAEIADMLQSAAGVLPAIVQSYAILSPLKNRDRDPEDPTVFDFAPADLFPASVPFPVPASATMPSPALTELAALLGRIAVRRIPLVDSNEEPESVASTLRLTLLVAADTIVGRVCPTSWTTVRAVLLRSSGVLLSSLLSPLTQIFLPPPDGADQFPTELWRTFLTTVISLGSAELLAIESAPEQRRRAVWQCAGDTRATAGEILGVAWDALGWPPPPAIARAGVRTVGGFQVQYVPGLVGPVAALAVGVHAKLRRTATSVLRSMVIAEWTLASDLAAVEAAVADGLATAVGRCGPQSIGPAATVVAELEAALGPVAATDAGLGPAASRLISLVEELVNLLAAVHAADETAVPGALRLLELARLLGRDGLFVRYAHRLARLHIGNGHYAEAGLALRLHGDLYGWDAAPVRALTSPPLPAESAASRKERLYKAAIGLFERATAWENALDGYAELAAHYEHVTFDYAKLGRAQRAIAAVHEAIAAGRRAAPRFFRGAFRGLGWPADLRNRQFVFEAGPDERAATVAARLQAAYPACSVVGSDARASDGEGQFLVLAPVSVHRPVGSAVFTRARVAPAVRDFVSAGRPREFSVSVRRAGVVVAKLVFVTADAFPTILRRSEIVDVRTEQVGSVGHAVESVTRRTAELAVLVRRAGGDVLVGAGEVATSPADAVIALATRLGRLLDPADDLACVSARELLRQPDLPSATLDDSITDAAESSATDLRPALRAVLLDHVVVLRKAVSFLDRTNHVEAKPFSTRLASVWAPESVAIDSLAGEDDRVRVEMAEVDGLTDIMARISEVGSAGHHRPLGTTSVPYLAEPVRVGQFSTDVLRSHDPIGDIGVKNKPNGSIGHRVHEWSDGQSRQSEKVERADKKAGSTALSSRDGTKERDGSIKSGHHHGRLAAFRHSLMGPKKKTASGQINVPPTRHESKENEGTVTGGDVGVEKSTGEGDVSSVKQLTTVVRDGKAEGGPDITTLTATPGLGLDIDLDLDLAIALDIRDGQWR